MTPMMRPPMRLEAPACRTGPLPHNDALATGLPPKRPEAPAAAPDPPLTVPVLAEIVTGLAAAEGLWRPHVRHDAAQRARVRLLATPAYEIWLLGWTPGQSVGLHDHGDANGAFVVVDGELVESTVAARGVVDRRLAPLGVGGIPAGALHDVANRSSHNATSIHAYSRPLRTMGFYRPDGSLVRTDAVHEQSTVVPSGALPGTLDLTRAGPT